MTPLPLNGIFPTSRNGTFHRRSLHDDKYACPIFLVLLIAAVKAQRPTRISCIL